MDILNAQGQTQASSLLSAPPCSAKADYSHANPQEIEVDCTHSNEELCMLQAQGLNVKPLFRRNDRNEEFLPTSHQRQLKCQPLSTTPLIVLEEPTCDHESKVGKESHNSPLDSKQVNQEAAQQQRVERIRNSVILGQIHMHCPHLSTGELARLLAGCSDYTPEAIATIRNLWSDPNLADTSIQAMYSGGKSELDAVDLATNRLQHVSKGFSYLQISKLLPNVKAHASLTEGERGSYESEVKS